MTYRFLHAADLHLDSPFKGLGQDDPVLAARLRDASLEAFERLVTCAIRERCQFVVVSGDIYDGLDRGVRAQLHLRAAAQRLRDAGIRLFLLHGNHDPVDEGYAAVRQWPANTHLFAGDEAETVAFDTDAGRVTVTGRSYPRKRVPEDLAAGYPAPDGDGLHVAMLHTQVVTSGDLRNEYSPCHLGALVRTGFHYWALGHIHEQKVLHDRAPVVAYPGNLQGRHFGECGPRGALLVEGPPDALTVRPVSLATVTFHRVPCDVTGAEDLDVVLDRLVDATPPGDELRLLRAELHGRGEVYEGLRRLGDLDRLRVSLQDRAPTGVTWLDVRSTVAPDLDLERLADGTTLAGALIRRAEAWDAARVRDELKDAKHKALGVLAKTLNDDQIDRLVQRAVLRAVGAVHGGGGA
jgi:DNA repair protein SbcD/Mre11